MTKSGTPERARSSAFGEAKNQSNWERPEILPSPQRPYRYGDSNPGFRTENCLQQAVCGRFMPAESKEFG